MAKKKPQKLTPTGNTDDKPDMPNFVAKHMNTFNRAVTMVDRKKKAKGSQRKSKHTNSWESKGDDNF